jgi:hypothetical protein
MSLAITTDKPSYVSGDLALVSVTRDAAVPPTGATYTIAFLETAADGSTVDTGSVDLLVNSGGTTTAGTTITGSSADGLVVAQVSDDGATVVLSVQLP